ncbi:TonB-dependent receptor [marine sediment metagenome]|uniref:TonB-dependent receptor n=1 Tax=marine sediment metagenome TaxID=412755 RepID=A0A1B6NXK4_9ZZZZ
MADSESNKRDLRGESYAGLARSGALGEGQLGSRQFEMSTDGIYFTGSSGLDAFSDPTMLQLAGPQVWGAVWLTLPISLPPMCYRQMVNLTAISTPKTAS